ncbi:hypothetical protein FRC09_001895 [Ceratobasidium sp. 395]|nr:hypothetical protein FRC09_001895 [Ceratobasidium sp. 395]
MNPNAEMTTDQRETLPTLPAKDKSAKPLARANQKPRRSTRGLDRSDSTPSESTTTRARGSHPYQRRAPAPAPALAPDSASVPILAPRSARTPASTQPSAQSQSTGCLDHVEPWLRNLLVHIGPMTQGGKLRRPVKSIFQPSEHAHVTLWVAEEIRRDIPPEIVDRLIALGPRPGDIVLLDFTNPPVPVASDQHGNPYVPIFHSVFEYNCYFEAYSRSLASKTPFVLTIEPTASQKASSSTDLSGVAGLSSLMSTPNLVMDDSPALLPSALESSPSPAPVGSGAQHFSETLHTPAERTAGPVDGDECMVRSSQLLHGQASSKEHSYPVDQQSSDAMYLDQSGSSAITVGAHYSSIHTSYNDWNEGSRGSGLDFESIWSALQAASGADISEHNELVYVGGGDYAGY